MGIEPYLTTIAIATRGTVLYPVHTETLQLALLVQEAQTVAVGKPTDTRHRERIATQVFHRSHKLAHRLRGVQRSNAQLSTIGEISGISPIERLRQLGFESIADGADRRPTVTVGILAYQLIQSFAIGRRHVLDISDILQPAFNLKRYRPRLSQTLEVLQLVHILQ